MARARLEPGIGMLLSFLAGITGTTDASPTKTPNLGLTSHREVMFPDVYHEPPDMTDYASDDSDDEDDSSSLEHQDQKSIWNEINELTLLGSTQTWPSKPNANVPVKKEPRFVGLIYIR